MKDIDIEAMEEACEFERRDADTKLQKMKSEIEDIREESMALGVLQKIHYDHAHNELLKYATLYQVRENKEYRKGGMNWEEFCEKIGESKRTVNEKLKDIRPLVENFQASLAHFSKVPFNKIRYLGRSVRADSAQIDEDTLLIDGVKISLANDNKEEIATAIDTLIETHKQEKENLQKKLEKQKANTDKIIEEETKGLKIERDALVKQVERLKPYDIEEKDETWSIEYLEKMERLCSEFEFAARHFIVDKRLGENFPLMAQAASKIYSMNKAISELRIFWEEEFALDNEI